MEAITTISEGEWNTSFNGICSEDSNNFMLSQFLIDNYSLPNEVQSCPNITLSSSSSFWPTNEPNFADQTNIDESYYLSIPHQIFVNNNDMMIIEMDHEFLNQDASKSNDIKLTDDDVKNFQLGSLQETPILEEMKEDKGSILSEMSKKRTRIPRQGSKRLKKCAKVDDNNEEKNNNCINEVVNKQNSSGCCSEDDSNAALNGMCSSSSTMGKTRAGRGSATDHHSLYARRRRERINERLRILQNLVPNGTKVDISTMLEEAVQYVEFLQLQIKLLSSDELWMYSPIAYNGMEIGFDFKIPTSKPQSSRR